MGHDIQLIPGAAELPEEAAAFLQSLVTSADCRVVTWSAPIVSADRAKRCAVCATVVQHVAIMFWQEGCD